MATTTKLEICVALSLYSQILGDRLYLECWLHQCELEVAEHPELNKKSSLHPPDLREYRRMESLARREKDELFQVMENMALESSLTFAELCGQPTEGELLRKPICKILKD